MALAVCDPNHPDHLYALNAAKPILTLPVEVLGIILQEFVKPFDATSDGFEPHFDYSVSDCSALTPVAQTCRRLREVVQSLLPVIKSIIIKPEDSIDVAATQPRSKDVGLNVFISMVYRNPLSSELRDWYTTEVHRVQELHLTRLGQLAMDFWSPLLRLPAPRLRFLSLTSLGGSWLPPKGVFLPFPAQASQLRYLTLKTVCFLPENRLASLTHLALIDVYVPRVDSNLMTFLARCPNLESLVLSNIRGSIVGKQANLPVVHLPRLRLITLHHLEREKLALYLQSLPRLPGQALQLHDYLPDGVVHRTLVPKYTPDAHTLCITHHADPSHAVDNIRRSWSSHHLVSGTISITSIGPNGVFHATLPTGQIRYFSFHKMISDLLADKSALAGVREAWVVGIHPSRLIPDMNEPEGTKRFGSEMHQLAISVRTELVALPALATLTLVVCHTLEPNLHILPNARAPSFVSHSLKTLRLVLCHGLPGSAWQSTDGTQKSGPSGKRPTLSLSKVREKLATGQCAYLDTLVLQMGAHIVVDEGELLEVSKFVPTVKIERIDAIPSVALPALCREPAVSNPFLGALW